MILYVMLGDRTVDAVIGNNAFTKTKSTALGLCFLFFLFFIYLLDLLHGWLFGYTGSARRR